MGYTLHVPCKSMKARDEMSSFLKEHYRKYSQMFKEAGMTQRLRDIGATEKEAECINAALTSDKHDPTTIHTGRKDLYIPSDRVIGFSFIVSFPHDQFMYSLCCWIALKVGRTRRLKNATYDYQGKDPLPDIQVPCFVYANFEPLPVLRDLDMTDIGPDARDFLGQCRNVDEVGFQPTQEWAVPTFNMMYGYGRLDVVPVMDEVLHAELKRLESLWNARKV